MIKRRRNTFETNSSSTHSITFSSRDDKLSASNLYINPDGDIVTHFAEYGWDIVSYTSQEDKLSYLVTMCAELSGIGVYTCDECKQQLSIDELRETEDFKIIEDEICNYTGATHLVIDCYSSGYVDHQSSTDEYRNINQFLSDNNTSVIDFVFGNAILNTDNDNH